MSVFRKSERDGEVIIDHRESPGLTFQEALAAGRSCLVAFGMPKLFKSATFTCSHCDRIVIKNPLRTRNRGECPQCDRPICDDPCAVRYALDGECRCQAKRIDEWIKSVQAQSLTQPSILQP